MYFYKSKYQKNCKMSTNSHKKFKLREHAERNPFSLPDDYFNTLSSRVNEKRRMGEGENGRKGEGEKRRMGESEIRPTITLWKRVRPHLALAAAITGFAFISLTTLQLILGDRNNESGYYDLSLLDEAGIILDESAVQESLDYGEDSEDTYTEWELEAMTYLASSDVGLDLLLAEN